MDLSPLFEKLSLSQDILAEQKDLFEEAFTHRSLGSGEQRASRHNERLEFLGDAVLELVVTAFLYDHFKQESEGVLTNYRSALVKRENLALVARGLDLGAYLRLSKGEEESGGREKDYLLANVVEAFIGAVYLAFGMEVATEFIQGQVLVHLDTILAEGSHIDAKSSLQEYTQGAMGITPQYKVLKEQGLDHDKTFYIGVFLGDDMIGEGQGGSKKEAQVEAAAQALEGKEGWKDKRNL